MPRGCGCAGNSCGCLIVAGAGVTVSGTGNASEPYVVSVTQSGLLELGPYTVPGAGVNLTGITDTNATIALEYEVDAWIQFSTNAPIGTRVEIRAMPSFGSTLEFVGNVWVQEGQAQPVPAPALGNLWISAVKMNSLDWFVRIDAMTF
jgi:hypothetical protein